jgi:hypothetical protein
MEKICQLSNVSDLVYQVDIDKTMTSDYWVEKFLEWNRGSIIKSVEGILHSLQVQKEYRLRELKESDFASEAFLVGSVFRYEVDRKGRRTLFSQMRFSPSCPHTREMSKQFALFLHLKMEEDSGEQGYICVNDFAGLTFNNVDFKLIKAALDMRLIFPNSAHLFICVNVPFAIRAVFNSIKYAMPPEERKGFLMITPNELQQIIDVDNIPDFLGGRCKTPYKGPGLVPKGCRSMKDNLLDLIAREKSNNNEDTNRKASAVMLPDSVDRETLMKVAEYYGQLFGISGH